MLGVAPHRLWLLDKHLHFIRDGLVNVSFVLLSPSPAIDFVIIFGDESRGGEWRRWTCWRSRRTK